MKRTTKVIAGASMALALMAGSTPAMAQSWAPRYAAAWTKGHAAAIDEGMGAPSNWSRALSPVRVKQALTRPTVTSRINRMDSEIRGLAWSASIPLSMARDVLTCDVAYVYMGRAQDECYSGVEVRYYRYV